MNHDCPLWATKLLDSMAFASERDVWVILFAITMSPEPPTNSDLCKMFENWDWSSHVNLDLGEETRLMYPYWDLYLLFDDEGFGTGGNKVFEGLNTPKVCEYVTMDDVNAMIAMWHKIAHPHHIGIEKHWRKQYSKYANLWDDVRKVLKLPSPNDGGLGRIFI